MGSSSTEGRSITNIDMYVGFKDSPTKVGIFNI
jgi:hypothetical protein